MIFLNIGEKIKTHRKIKCLSQKQLSELTGISEISIRKYEAGDRKPKIEQLMKIANALDIEESTFFDIPQNDIKTVSDAMGLLYLLRSRVGWDIVYECSDHNKIDESTISIRFHNDAVNQHIENIALKEIATQKDIEMYDGLADENDTYEWEKNLMRTVLDDEQRNLYIC